MKAIRIGLFALSLVVFAMCCVLLLNRTDSNPTRRRYSSSHPAMTGQASSQVIGSEAETILQTDLNNAALTRNDVTTPRKYFCRTASTKPPDGDCIAYYAGLTSSSRRPDFVSDTLIIESKNRVDLTEDDRDLLNQIGDYSLVAISTGRQLWIYTRTDTTVDPKYYALAAATGGGVVQYFVADGYTNKTDTDAKSGLAVSTSIIGVIGLWEVRQRRRIRLKPQPVKTAPTHIPVTTPSSSRRPSNLIDKTRESVERSHSAAQRFRDKLD